jgi:hypothetical protein
MIQAEKQRSTACYNFGKERMEHSKKTPWSKKISNKENITNEQLHTPQQKNKEAEISWSGFTSLVSGFNQRSKSPLSSRCNTLSNCTIDSKSQ